MMYVKDIAWATIVPSLIAVHWLTGSDWPMYPIVLAAWVSFFVFFICAGIMKLFGEPMSMFLLHLSKSVDMFDVKRLVVSTIVTSMTLCALWIGGFTITFWIYMLVVLFIYVLRVIKHLMYEGVF
jgi:hypothetical protein